LLWHGLFFVPYVEQARTIKVPRTPAGETLSNMRTFTLILTLNLLAILCAGQSIPELQEQLQNTQGAAERLELNVELANALMRRNDEQSIDYAKEAHSIAQQLNNNAQLARTAYLTAQAYERERETRNHEVWLKYTLAYAKKAGDSDLIIKSVNERAAVWRKKRNYRKAYNITNEAFEYLSSKGTSIGELEGKFERQRAQLEKEKLGLEQERKELQAEIDRLSKERNDLSNDKQDLQQEREQLVKAKKNVEDQIDEKEEKLATISEEKQRAEALAQERAEAVKVLSRDTLEKRYLLEEARATLAEEELKVQQRNNLIRLAGVITGSLLLLALTLYARFRSKRRSAKTLAEKNQLIETERQRSDELLLNILPAPIANELKESGKAKARRFQDVTVLFSDFKNFTQISEQLGPEELVEELDKCFKAFDYIIAEYADIEKIKTIGDAYMCASGLSDRKSIPYNIIKAALSMQEYLEEYAKVRQRQGRPYFEARIGIHTGPVVAGVVGIKKFAYDIWGDTVNIAARMEANGEEGKVNISQSTYSLVKYKFTCHHRGKVHAKNKGNIDMYFVDTAASTVPA